MLKCYLLIFTNDVIHISCYSAEVSDFFFAVQWSYHLECILYICNREILLKHSHVLPYVQTLNLLFPLEVKMWRWRCRVFGSLFYTCFEMLNCLEERATAAAAVAIFSPTLSCSIDRETTVSWWKWEQHPWIRDTIFFFSTTTRACGPLMQYLQLNFQPLPP